MCVCGGGGGSNCAHELPPTRLGTSGAVGAWVSVSKNGVLVFQC